MLSLPADAPVEMAARPSSFLRLERRTLGLKK